MPSQRGLAPGGAGKATTSRSGRAVVKSLREDDDDEDGDGDEGSQVLRREGICGLLYSKDDLTPRMAGQLREVHVHRDFKMPAQDPAKVQFFDPDRGRKALGMTKPGASRPRAQMLLPLPAQEAGGAQAMAEHGAHLQKETSTTHGVGYISNARRVCCSRLVAVQPCGEALGQGFGQGLGSCSVGTVEWGLCELWVGDTAAQC